MLQLNGIYKDGMVFQQGKEMRIRGVADTAGTVVATLKDENNKAIVKGSTSVNAKDEEAEFLIILPETAKGGPFSLEIKLGRKEQIVLTDIYVGEVWLAAGQDNMVMPVFNTDDAEELIKNTKELPIRYYKIPKADKRNVTSVKAESNSSWVNVDKKSLGKMSAVAFYFASTLMNELPKDTMIGIVECSAEGSNIMSWMSKTKINSTKDGKKALKEFNDSLLTTKSEDYIKASAEIGDLVKENKARIKAMLKENKYIKYGDLYEAISHGPLELPMLKSDARRPSAFYDNMLLRIAPFNFKGVIFYQGEADFDERYNEYEMLFKSLIEDWREVLGDENLPFIFAQLPMYIDKQHRFMGYDDMHLPLLRDGQERVARNVDNAYMVVLSDCGEFDNLYPSDKKTPGDRMGRMALKHIYDYDVPSDAPHIIDIRKGSSGIELSFAGDFSSIKCNCSNASNSGFEVAERTGEFVSAMASVDFDGKTVILECPSIVFPSKVRYAHFSYGSTSLVTDTNLAIMPFNKSIEKSLGSEI